MKLKKAVRKPIKRTGKTVEFEKPVEVAEEKKQRKKSVNTLPPDEYPELVQKKRILVRHDDNFRQYLEITVKRFDGDDENAPFVQVTMYQESERYTGYLKGKTIYLPLENLADLVDTLTDTLDECEDII